MRVLLCVLALVAVAVADQCKEKCKSCPVLERSACLAGVDKDAECGCCDVCSRSELSYKSDPPEYCHLNVKKKIAKNLTFFQKIAKNEHFWHFFEKMSSFWQFFDILMAIFGGSGSDII